MSAIPASGAIDLDNSVAAACDAVARGLEYRDPELAASVYADNIEMIIVNRNFPPSNPLVRKGRDAVFELYRDVCSREMTHSVTAVVLGTDSFAMRESCQYPDGCRVIGHFICEMKGGKIVRQFNLDCWDE